MRIHCGMPKEVQSRTAMPLVIMACLTPSASSTRTSMKLAAEEMNGTPSRPSSL